MIEAMADDIDDFPGEPNRVRCFNHVINLVAKSLIKLFDVPKAKRGGNEKANAPKTMRNGNEQADASKAKHNKKDKVDEAVAALQELAGEIDLEDLQTQVDTFTGDGDVGSDDIHDIVDEIALMTEDEVAAFRELVLPITTALLKVSAIRLVWCSVLLLICPRSANCPTRLSILPLSSSLSGNGLLKSFAASLPVSSPGMFEHDGTLHLTCWRAL
jgi:hypothetical protein